MKDQPLRTTVIGSYPFPSWLEFASQHLEEFGSNEYTESAWGSELPNDVVFAALVMRRRTKHAQRLFIRLDTL